MSGRQRAQRGSNSSPNTSGNQSKLASGCVYTSRRGQQSAPPTFIPPWCFFFVILQGKKAKTWLRSTLVLERHSKWRCGCGRSSCLMGEGCKPARSFDCCSLPRIIIMLGNSIKKHLKKQISSTLVLHWCIAQSQYMLQSLQAEITAKLTWLIHTILACMVDA